MDKLLIVFLILLLFAVIALWQQIVCIRGRLKNHLEIEFTGISLGQDLEPGYSYVLTCDKNLTAEQVRYIRAAWSECFPETKAFVISGGLRFSVIKLANMEADTKQAGAT